MRYFSTFMHWQRWFTTHKMHLCLIARTIAFLKHSLLLLHWVLFSSETALQLSYAETEMGAPWLHSWLRPKKSPENIEIASKLYRCQCMVYRTFTFITSHSHCSVSLTMVAEHAVLLHCQARECWFKSRPWQPQLSGGKIEEKAMMLDVGACCRVWGAHS